MCLVGVGGLGMLLNAPCRASHSAIQEASYPSINAASRPAGQTASQQASKPAFRPHHGRPSRLAAPVGLGAQNRAAQQARTLRGPIQRCWLMWPLAQGNARFDFRSSILEGCDPERRLPSTLPWTLASKPEKALRTAQQSLLEACTV